MGKRTSQNRPPFWSETAAFWAKWIVAVAAGFAVFGISLSNYRPTVKFETDNVVAGVELLAARVTRGELRSARNQLTEVQFIIYNLKQKGVAPDFKIVEQLNFWRGEVERLEGLLRNRRK